VIMSPQVIAAIRDTEKTLEEQRKHLDRTLAEQSKQLDRTLAAGAGLVR
jgi:hypothetical protein